MPLSQAQLDELRKKSIATPLTPEEQANFTGEANAVYDPQRAVAAERTRAAKLTAGGEYADLESRIKARVSGEQADITTRYAPMAGFSFNEGLPIARGNIQSAGSTDITKADIARTLAESEAILQESQANLDITKEAKGYATTLADREFNRRTQEAGLYGQQYGLELDNQRFEIDQQDKLRAAQLSASAGGGDSLTAAIAQILAEKTQQPTTPQAQSPMIGNIPLSDLQNDVVYGSGGQVSFNTDAGMLTREQFADYLANNVNGKQGRQTQGWQSIYKQVMDNFKEKQTSSSNTPTRQIADASPLTFFNQGKKSAKKGF